MRPAIEVYRDAAYEDAKQRGSDVGEENAAAVIAADRLALVAAIVAEIRQVAESAEGDTQWLWSIADHIEAKFGGGNNGDR